MRIQIDYSTLALLLDLPTDMDIVGVDTVGESVVVVVDTDSEDYPENAAALYGADDSGLVSLIGLEQLADI
jgi:hypothetical protein